MLTNDILPGSSTTRGGSATGSYYEITLNNEDVSAGTFHFNDGSDHWNYIALSQLITSGMTIEAYLTQNYNTTSAYSYKLSKNYVKIIKYVIA